MRWIKKQLKIYLQTNPANMQEHYKNIINYELLMLTYQTRAVREAK